MKFPKLTTTDRSILLVRSKDRAKRFFQAVDAFSTKLKSYGGYDVDPITEGKILDETLSRFKLPSNLCIDAEECANEPETLKLIDGTLRKMLSQKCEADDVTRLVWHCEEHDEIDLGWVIFERPQGYYHYEADQFWNGRDLTETLLSIAGLHETADHDHEPILFALNNPPATKRASISNALDNIASGGDAMEAIKELLGDQLVSSF